MIYLAILALLFLLSFHYDICGKKKYKSFWYLAVLGIFILFAGLRWRVGTDTIQYLYFFYHDYPTLSAFSFEDYYVGKDPFFVLINSFVKSIGGRFYWVQLIQTTFVNTLILHYFRKHSKYIFTCCLFYFLLSYISFTMEIMRASFSIVISLYAFDYFIEKKWAKGYLFLLFALMFHTQTLVLFLFPLFLFLRLDKKGVVILIGAYVIGVFIQGLLADYVSLFEGNEILAGKMSAYTSEGATYGENNHNITYYIVTIFPRLFYPLFALWYVKRSQSVQSSNIVCFEPFIMLGLIFVLIQIHFLIAYRYVEYFTIYFAMFFAEAYVGITVPKRRKRIDIAYLCSLALFFPAMISFLYLSFKEPRYNYSSVLDRTIDPQKESQFKELTLINSGYSYPAFDEY